MDPSPDSQESESITDRRSANWDLTNAVRNYSTLIVSQAAASFFSFASVWILTKNIGADGYGATYIVGEVEVVPRSVDPQTIINDIGYEALTLITCGGTWTGTEYTVRIIVRAYRV